MGLCDYGTMGQRDHGATGPCEYGARGLWGHGTIVGTMRLWGQCGSMGQLWGQLLDYGNMEPLGDEVAMGTWDDYGTTLGPCWGYGARELCDYGASMAIMGLWGNVGVSGPWCDGVMGAWGICDQGAMVLFGPSGHEAMGHWGHVDYGVVGRPVVSLLKAMRGHN